MLLPYGMIKTITVVYIDSVLDYSVLNCIVINFSTTTDTFTKIGLFVECIAKVIEVGHKRHYPVGRLEAYVDNLEECIEGCVDADDCVAIDYVEDVCFEIAKQIYSETNLIIAENALHYYIGTC